ncbi:MAG: hydrogenase 2 operon protein HybA [Acidobacteriota bacterium]
MNRRTALKVLSGAGAGAATAALPAVAREPKTVPEDAVGMLYDTTRCIGCKTCVVACAKANDLVPDRGSLDPGVYQAPDRLNSQTKNIIKLYTDGVRRSFMKQQCMHCVDPACAAACMMGSFQKREYGIVTWKPERCIGCRYCQIACPFGIPKFEWTKSVPKMVKCEMCNHLIAQGKIPACCEVCPRQAVIYGKRADLLAEAHRRLEEHPKRYVPKVYGEHDAGGTQVLYLSHLPFENIGLQDLGELPSSLTAENVQHTVYKGFAAPVIFYAFIGGIMWRNRRLKQGDDGEEGS